jgi:hypothetical protein
VKYPEMKRPIIDVTRINTENLYLESLDFLVVLIIIELNAIPKIEITKKMTGSI